MLDLVLHGFIYYVTNMYGQQHAVRSIYTVTFADLEMGLLLIWFLLIISNSSTRDSSICFSFLQLADGAAKVIL